MKLRELIVGILDSKKAKQINVIDISGISILADYFIICTGTSATHVKALADELEMRLEEAGIRRSHCEGYDSANWILADYGEVVVHIFKEDDRKFYNLERLWADGIVGLGI